MIIGIIGSRRRNSSEDYEKLLEMIDDLIDINDENLTKIVTGDCSEGGDKFARIIGYNNDSIELEVKEVNMTAFPQDRWGYIRMYYERDERIAKEEMDYLIALVAPDRTGGTEKTIEFFKKYHKNWKDKLILL